MAVETRGLARSFGAFRAVDGIDLAVPVGSTYGFLGPNGSGKTTTIRVLLGLLNPSAGSWSLLGRPMPRSAMSVLPHVGALVEGPAFYPWLSGWENLARLDAMGPSPASATRRARISSALERVGLAPARDKKYKAYSLGMRQRLGLAWALVRPRQLLVLDEPTNGMDPQGTREIRNLVRHLAAEGTTIFLSSHLLSEIEQICSHVGVMHKGRLLMQGTLAELRATAAPKLRVEVDDPVRASEVLSRMGLADLGVQGEQVAGTLDGQLPEDCCRSLVEAGVGVRMLVREQLSLEDAFVALTGEGFDVAG
ncbi:MAG: ABC transporter ATP-binding protein [Acidimicrobiales bacterium]